MTTTLSLATGPATEPVTLAEAKLHLRVTHAAEDSLINGLITQARQWAETVTRRALIEQEWIAGYPGFPTANVELPFPLIRLPLGRTRAVEKIEYYDGDDALQTLTGPSSDTPGSDYTEALNADQGGMVMPPLGGGWPPTGLRTPSVKVYFTAGYGAAASDIPADIISGILFRIADLYAIRTQADTALKGQAGRYHDIPKGFLEPYVLRLAHRVNDWA